MPVPDPVTRKEMYLNKAATGSGSIPATPVTREEMYLAEIANGGGGGGGGALIVNLVEDENEHLDKTAGEIMSAIQSGMVIVIHESGLGGSSYAYLMLQSADYSINPFTHNPLFIFHWVSLDGDPVTARSEDESDYPIITE